MQPAVRLFHAEASPGAGPLTRGLAATRLELARRVAEAFRAAGATDVEIVAGPPDDTPFGARLRELVRRERPSGIVVAGSGSLVLARADDLRPFLACAAAEAPQALANNRYSADVVAIAQAGRLVDLPDLPSDNALPRWLSEVAGYEVDDARGRVRLQADVDTPLDALLVDREARVGAPTGAVLDALRQVAVAGR